MPQIDKGIIFQTCILFVPLFVANYIIFKVKYLEKLLLVLKGRTRLLKETF